MNAKQIVWGLTLLLLSTSAAKAEISSQQLNRIISQSHQGQSDRFNFSSFNFTNSDNLWLAQNISLNSSSDTTQKLTKADYLNYQANGAEVLNNTQPANSPLAQVTNVNQLRDVSPTDWAYEALRSLVDRYGCIAGFPNQTYRGNQPLSRYEFAAGLNSCLNQIERLIAASESVAQEDLQTAQKLTEEFEAELATIGGRIDNLEGRIGFLEDNQFSTTTILNGEVIFAIADAFGGNPPGGCAILPDDSIGGGDANSNSDIDCRTPEEPSTETVFANFVRLGLQSSFTGQDRLRVYLTSGNFDNGGFTNPQSLNTYMSRLGYQADLDNSVFIDILEYRFPAFDDKVVFYGSTFGFALSNVLTANSPYFDIGRGAVSRFGQLNPILRIGGAMEAGVGFDWSVIDNVRLQAAYGTRDSGDPDEGFFGSDHSTLGVQVLVQPTDNIVTGINYVNAYSSDGSLGTFTGSVNAETLGLWSQAGVADENLGSPGNPNPNAPSGFGCCGREAGDLAARINAVGGSFQWRLLENLTFATWGGYIFADFLDPLPDSVDGTGGETPFADVATFSVSLGLSDPLGREGDLLGFIFGMPPKLVDAGPETVGVPVPFFEQVISQESETPVTDNNPNILNGPQRVGQKDEATSLHFELFYRLKVSDKISVTPGFFLVTNPGHIEDNDTIYVGTLRTTFRF